MIRDGWGEDQLRNLVEIKTGPFGSMLHQRDYVVGGIPIVNPSHIKRGRIVPGEFETVDRETVERLAEYTLSVGDIVMGRRGEMGRCALVQRDQDGWLCGSGSFILRKRAAVSMAFLQRLISQPKSIAYLEQASIGSTMNNLNHDVLGALCVALPSFEEQVAIAEAISEVDALVEALDALIAKKRDMKQAVMQQLLTGRTRLPGFTEEWEILTVGSFARLLKGRGLSRGEISEGGSRQCLLYGELFTKYNQVARAVEGRTDSLDGEPSVWGDVLMPGSTTTTGEDLATATALLVDEVRLGGDVNIIRPNLHRVDSRWLAYVLTHSHRQDIAVRAQGVTIHHLYGRDIASIAIQVPGLEEQSKIAEVLSDMDAEIDALVAQREKAELMKQGMMQELLSGRVRLA